MPQTFEMIFVQYQHHPESKSLAPHGNPYTAESEGLLKRYPVTTTGVCLIGKETERGWEQAEDVSTLLPSLLRYAPVNGKELRLQLSAMSLRDLERATGLSRHTILRARAGRKVHPRTLALLTRIALLR